MHIVTVPIIIIIYILYRNNINNFNVPTDRDDVLL